MSLVVCAILIGAFALTRDHWWFRVPVRVAVPINAAESIELWRSTTGKVLVAVNDRDLYFVDPHSATVGVANRGELTRLFFIAFTRHGPPVCVRMPSVKVQVNPDLMATRGFLAFNRADGSRLELHYGDN